MIISDIIKTYIFEPKYYDFLKIFKIFNNNNYILHIYITYIY